MNGTTLTMAGHMAHAGDSRLVAGTRVCASPLAAAVPAVLVQGVYGHHQSAKWTVGAIAKPETFTVFDRKNRPTRQHSEISP